MNKNKVNKKLSVNELLDQSWPSKRLTVIDRVGKAQMVSPLPGIEAMSRHHCKLAQAEILSQDTSLAVKKGLCT